jgi:hypothetical protein
MNHLLKNGWVYNTLIFTFFGLCGSSIVVGQQSENEVVEKGTVNWTNDLDVAKQESKKTGKPLFLLFQEIPG